MEWVKNGAFKNNCEENSQERSGFPLLLWRSENAHMLWLHHGGEILKGEGEKPSGKHTLIVPRTSADSVSPRPTLWDGTRSSQG